jgi:hypothetical protein
MRAAGNRGRAPFAFCLVVSVALLAGMCGQVFAAPAVTNVRASQRAGTKLVDICYHLNGGPAWVSHQENRMPQQTDSLL